MMTKVEKIWDENSRPVQEDGYSIKEINWVLGENVFLEKDFTKCTKQLFKQLYKEIKHGDKEHQKWLKDKMEEFLGSKF